MHEAINYGVNYLANHWEVILQWFAGGGGIWLVTQITKNLRNWEKASTIQKFVLLAGFLGSASDWFLQNYSTSFSHAQNPFVFFPVATGVLFTIATFVHHTPIKKLAGFMSGTVQPYFAAVNELKQAKLAAQKTPAAQDSFQ